MKLLAKTLEAIRGAYTGKYSVVTNTITAGGLGALGDIIAQKAEKGIEFQWDMKRTRNIAILCTFTGPLMHYWYRFLDGRFPGKAKKAVATKVGIDLLSGPVWYGWFIGGLSILREDTWDQTKREIRNKVPIVISVDLTLWPILQGLNFSFFPPHYRILVIKCNELIFDVIFSHIANNEYTLSSLVRVISKKLSGGKTE